MSDDLSSTFERAIDLEAAVQVLLKRAVFSKGHLFSSPGDAFQQAVETINGEPIKLPVLEVIRENATRAQEKLADLFPELARAVNEELLPQIENDEDTLRVKATIATWIVDNREKYEQTLQGLEF